MQKNYLVLGVIIWENESWNESGLQNVLNGIL